jgi:hypothetical protein
MSVVSPRLAAAQRTAALKRSGSKTVKNRSWVTRSVAAQA